MLPGEAGIYMHMCIHMYYSIDREIFAVKIVCILNFLVKNISPPDSSAM